jgi:hypothetical protein
MTKPAEPAHLSELVNALLEATAPVALLLDHMAHAPTRPQPDEAAAVLRELLEDVLEPLATMLAPRDLRTTTAVLEATVPLIAENVLMVPHEPARGPRRDPRETHRSGPRRRTRRTRGRE